MPCSSRPSAYQRCPHAGHASSHVLYRTATVQVAILRPDHDSSFSGSSTPSAMSLSISAQYSRLWKP
jgi:hypothetical protein